MTAKTNYTRPPYYPKKDSGWVVQQNEACPYAYERIEPDTDAIKLPPRRTAATWCPPLAPERLLIHYNTELARDEGLHVRAGQGGAWRAQVLGRQMGRRRWRRRWTPGAFYVEAAAVAHLSGHLHTHTDEVSRRSGGASPAQPCERERRPPIVALPSPLFGGRSMTGIMTGSGRASRIALANQN